MISTSHHPQTDGQTERQIRTIKQNLRLLWEELEFDWVDRLSDVEFALNYRPSASKGFSSFETNFDLLFRLPDPLRLEHLPESSGDLVFHIQKFVSLLTDISDNLRKAQESKKQQANKKKRNMEVKPADLVWLATKIAFPLSSPISR